MAATLRIVFAGTPDFSVPVLQALIDSEHEIVAVYTQPDRPAGRGREPRPSPVKQLAQQHALNVFQPESLRDEAEQQQLKALDADLMIVEADIADLSLSTVDERVGAWIAAQPRVTHVSGRLSALAAHG